MHPNPFPPCPRCGAGTAPDRRHRRLGRCAGCGLVWWRTRRRRVIPLELRSGAGRAIAQARVEAIRGAF